MRFVLAALAAFALSACANSSLLVEQPNSSDYTTGSLRISHASDSIDVDEENLTYTQAKLEEELLGGDEPLFEAGEGMTVRWRYVGFNEGSRAGRYLTGGLAGGSKVTLEVEFVDPDGNVLAVVRGEGSVNGGFFGGSNKTGIDKAIEEIAEYAAREFR